MAEDLRQFIRQLKETVDLVEVIGRFVQLKRAGQSFKGRCPFHQEKTPSFNVVPGKKIFHCFGCGAGGSVVDFIMRHERLEFIEAIRWLAEDTGLEMPEARQVDPKVREERQRLEHVIYNANEEAIRWFRRNLQEGRNQLASDYLPSRGLDEETCEKFQIGASLDEWSGLRDHLARLGFSDDLLVTAGLCAQSGNGRVYDRFRNRLMFPIWDTNGRPVGFGGRRLTEEKESPKYINTSETPVYHKSNYLYALNLAQRELSKTGFAIICEGYMDVIAAHAAGFPQAVASLGTALTLDQSRLLKRFAPRAYFLYDGDSAGQKAMLEGGRHLLQADIDARVIVLPDGKDPDDFLKAEGSEALIDRMDRAMEFIDFAISTHQQSLNLTEMRSQAELVERLTPLIESIANDALREIAVGRLGKKLPLLPPEAITRIMNGKKEKERKRIERQEFYDKKQASDGEEQADNGGQGEGGQTLPLDPLTSPSSAHAMERRLLKMMLEDHPTLEYIRANLQHDWVTNSPYGAWIFYFNDHQGFIDSLIEEAEINGEMPGDKAIVTELLAWEVPKDGCSPEMAAQLLLLMQERHQGTLARQLFDMIDNKELSEADVLKMMKAFHLENQERMNTAGSQFRTKDSSARGSRLK